MTDILEPVLTGRSRMVEATIRRATLNRWKREHPELHFTTVATRNSERLRVSVMLMPTDLAPAGTRCYRTTPQAYRAGNARGRKWWGIEVRGETGEFRWLDNFETKHAAQEAADTWFMIHGIDPSTVEVR